MTDQKSTPVWVVIPAAGVGQRMQSEYPKQYLSINNKTIIEHTLDCFLQHNNVAGVVVVLSSGDEYWQSLNIKSELKPLFTTQVTLEDDSNRSDSVLQGLNYLRAKKSLPKDAWVMIHDAARPCLKKTDIDSLLDIRTVDSVGGILACPVRDTMKRAQLNKDTGQQEELATVSKTESRENLWHALTPQMFRIGDLIAAIKYCKNHFIAITDECSAMESMGVNPILVEGSYNNIKVTYPDDIELVTLLISRKQ